MRNEKTYDLAMVMIVTFLTCWFFWEAIIRSYVESYIKDQYGTAIIETKNNSALTLEILNQNDDFGN